MNNQNQNSNQNSGCLTTMVTTISGIIAVCIIIGMGYLYFNEGDNSVYKEKVYSNKADETEEEFLLVSDSKIMVHDHKLMNVRTFSIKRNDSNKKIQLSDPPNYAKLFNSSRVYMGDEDVVVLIDREQEPEYNVYSDKEYTHYKMHFKSRDIAVQDHLLVIIGKKKMYVGDLNVSAPNERIKVMNIDTETDSKGLVPLTDYTEQFMHQKINSIQLRVEGTDFNIPVVYITGDLADDLLFVIKHSKEVSK